MKPLSLLLATLFLVTGCKKSNSKINVTVLSATNSRPAGGIKVMLLTDKQFIRPNAVASETTNSEGESTFNVASGIKYYVYVYYKSPNEANAVHINIGKFNSEKELIYAARQTPEAKVGDDKFSDIDGDGIVGPYDKVVPVQAQSGTVNATYTIK
jgi:hypothetical protein